uniref:Uncharacterized protein n=1 Tax=Rhizophora mucronata TaxID=61149 RepID=A0A2P2LCU2_RHIMU
MKKNKSESSFSKDRKQENYLDMKLQ